MLNNTELLKTAGYINGQWLGFDSDNRFEVKNAYTKEVICTLPNMGAQETNMAIDAANQAWQLAKYDCQRKSWYFKKVV